MRIQLLDTQVIDQIAAGEVLERPAHLVKELIENSLDAGARHIEVEYDQGGRRVRVQDDGQGIHKDDLALALARHATSKIQTPEDLWKLQTFGFRGEALASSAAVSRLTVVSRARESTQAYRVRSEFGVLSDVEEAGSQTGTIILIEDLFQNVPARLKFMKSESAEGSQIKNVVRALALANPAVEFRLKTQGKLLAVWAATSRDEHGFISRAKAVLEQEKLYFAHEIHDGYEVRLAFADPKTVAGNSRQIWIFVQNRWVQDRGLQAAVLDAYRSLLMHGEFPIAVVQLTLDPSELDVNIHPTKSQVKFRDSSAAFRSVHRTLRHAIEKAPWLLGVTRPVIPAMQSAEVLGATPSNLAFQEKALEKVQYQMKDFVRSAHEEKSSSPGLSVQDLQEFASSREMRHRSTAEGPWSRLQVLGQADLTYILAQSESALVLIDQHAAHERVAFERLMRAWKTGEIEVQNFLLPFAVQMEPEHVESLLRVEPDLTRLGLSFDPMGHDTVAVRSAPALLQEKALTITLQTVAREISEKGGSFVLEKKIGDICASMACHSVVRAGQALSSQQMQSLLQQMDEFPLSSFCPHGRPVSVEYPFSQIERAFGRIV